MYIKILCQTSDNKKSGFGEIRIRASFGPYYQLSYEVGSDNCHSFVPRHCLSLLESAFLILPEYCSFFNLEKKSCCFTHLTSKQTAKQSTDTSTPWSLNARFQRNVWSTWSVGYMEKIHKPAAENVSSSEKLTDMMLKVIPQKKSYWTVFFNFQ